MAAAGTALGVLFIRASRAADRRIHSPLQVTGVLQLLYGAGDCRFIEFHLTGHPLL